MTFDQPFGHILQNYGYVPPGILPVERLRKSALSSGLKRTLDRVNVLGDGETSRYGHSGCVNAVSWAEGGNLLLTGGDDKTVRLWRIDSSDLQNSSPYVCRSVINTGHTANIFNVQMLPCSNRIVTCAGDRTIRVFDASTALEVKDGVETNFGPRQTNERVIRCHARRVKKLVTEESPDVFLSLGEDGTVRQHDLRNRHDCHGHASCPPPLVQSPFELSTLSMSPMTPYQFVVAGESPYGFLFDRRYIGRVLKEEWGNVSGIGDGLTNCVRRFGRPPKHTDDAQRSRRREHITGSRVSASNGHEVLLTYSSDKIYLYSTRDDPHTNDDLSTMAQALLPPNSEPKNNSLKAKGVGRSPEPLPHAGERRGSNEDNEHGADGSGRGSSPESDGESESHGDDMDALLDVLARMRDDGSEETDDDDADYLSDVPVILPRGEYAGARNVETVKDVNFLGPSDEWIVSGSDDGNWFMWDKKTGKVEGIYEGDNHVVNVVEGHPSLPLVAVSGIDTTVKLFAPTTRKSAFSRIENADRIMEENRSNRRVGSLYNFSSLLAHGAMAAILSEPSGHGSEGPRTVQCPTQ